MGKKRERKETADKKEEDKSVKKRAVESESEESAEEDEEMAENEEGDYTPAKPVVDEEELPQRHSLRKRERKPILEDEIDDEKFEEMITQPTPGKPIKKKTTPKPSNKAPKEVDDDSTPIANRRPTRAARMKAEKKQLEDSDDEESQVLTRSQRKEESGPPRPKPTAGRALFKGKANLNKRQVKAERKERREEVEEKEPSEVSEHSEPAEPSEPSEAVRKPGMTELNALAHAVAKDGIAEEDGLKKKDGIWKKITMSILNILSTEEA